MTKPELRKKYIQLRNSLTGPEYLEVNRRLCDLFFLNVDLIAVAILHVFLPVAEKKEPDTYLIIDRLRREFPTLRIAIPKINPESKELDAVYFEKDHHMVKNSWGIPEPVDGELVPPRKIDLVIAPLLIFDGSGQRVGYGKGYYDKFLAQCRIDVKKIGLCAFPPEPKIDGINAFDIPLDYCVTPDRFYRF